MKTAVLLLALFLVVAVGALCFSLSSGPRDASTEHHAAATSEPAASTAASDARSAEVLQRLDAFSRKLDDLQAEVAALRAGAAREPAAEVVQAAVPVDQPTAAFASEHRAAILKVIEDDRAEQKRKQEEEQRARDLQAALARAERTAKQFGLVGDQQKALADVYILERQKMEDLRNQLRDQGGPGGDPEAMRTSFRELRDWRLNELTTRLGQDLADKINESDIAAFRGGFGGGGGNGRRGGRGQGGQGGQDGGGNDGGNRPGGGF